MFFLSGLCCLVVEPLTVDFILELYCVFTVNTIELFFYFKGFGFAVLFLSQMREYLGV